MIRNKKPLFLACTVLLVWLLSGCSSVVTLQPLPQTIDQQEYDLLEGDWIAEDSVVSLRFARDGIGRIATLDWRDDQFRIDEAELRICKVPGKSYFTIRVREKGKWEDWYYVVRYCVTSRGDLVIWLPIVDAFSAAVVEGKLEGTVEKGKWSTQVTLAGAPSDILAFLNDLRNENLFELEDPIVLRRLFP